LLKEASRLKNDPYAMAPPRVVAAANELMGALTIVGRKPAADAIVRIIARVATSFHSVNGSSSRKAGQLAQASSVAPR
jgi:hypothetical protein